MLNDNDIIYIHKILLNKDITSNEAFSYKNYTLESLKNHIYKSQEFKDFRNFHLENLRHLIETEIGTNYSGINFEKFWKELIKLNYDTDKFLKYIRDIIQDIKKKYRDFYKKYFSLDKEINPNDLAFIIRENCSVEFYVSTSEFFFEECDTFISRLLEKI